MANQIYRQGMATLGFHNGPSMRFRLNPNDIRFNFNINTQVQETVGGRVVQVLGAKINDITISGSFGQTKNSKGQVSESWQIAEAFLKTIKEMVTFQSQDSTKKGLMHPAGVFSFSPKGWKFAVYIKGLSDANGGNAITHNVGKFAYDYVLTLFLVEDLSTNPQVPGTRTDAIATQRDKALRQYMDRISNGIGWKQTKYNGPDLASSDATFFGPRPAIPPSIAAPK